MEHGLGPNRRHFLSHFQWTELESSDYVHNCDDQLERLDASQIFASSFFFSDELNLFNHITS